MRRLGLIGFPMDLGGNMRGVDMGPSAIRLTDLEERLGNLGIEVNDLGNVLVHTRALIDEEEEGVVDHHGHAHFLGEIIRSCGAAADMVTGALDAGLLPVTLGGDHTVALGSMWAMARRHGRGGLIWIDAHADLNTPSTTLSGNVHGMALAIALGLCADDPRFSHHGWPQQCIDPEKTVLIATRDLDPAEREYLRRPGGPRVFTMADVDRRGIAPVAEEALQIASGGEFLHVTLDLDSVDPTDAPGVGTPVRGGLSYREAHLLMEMLAPADFTSIDVVEVNPVLDSENRTAALATELVCSLFGKRIL